MSAFLVKDNTVEAVVTHVRGKREGYPVFPETRHRISLKMRMMNLKSLAIRYGKDSIKEELRACRGYTCRIYPRESKVRIYKALQCFLYQCCEGNIPSSRLYKKLERIKNELPKAIVEDSQEYSEADWG